MVGIENMALDFLRFDHRLRAIPPAALDTPIERRSSGELVRRHGLRHDLVAVAIRAEVECSFRAAEFDLAWPCRRGSAIGIELRECHQSVAGIVPDDFQSIGHFAIVVIGEFAAERGDGERRIHAKRPVDLSDIVYAEIGELTARVVVEPSEPVERPVLVVFAHRRGPDPCVPIEVLWRVRVRGAADPLGPLVLNVKGSDCRHLADAAAADDLGGLRSHRAGHSLYAALHNALVVAGGLHHRPALGYAERERLLDVYILPGPAGVNHLQGVPVVRSFDNDSVEVPHLKQLAVVSELPGVRPDLLRSEIEIWLVNVAYCGHVGVLVSEERAEDLVASVAQADETETDTLVRAMHAIGAQGCRRGSQADCGYRRVEFPASDLGHRS